MSCKDGQFDIVEQIENSPFKNFSINLNAQHVNGMTLFDVCTVIRYSRVTYFHDCKSHWAFLQLYPKLLLHSVEHVRYCDSCDKSQEVCVALTEDIPVCHKIQDHLDPTGCGGLCILNSQVCLRIDTDAFKYVKLKFP